MLEPIDFDGAMRELRREFIAAIREFVAVRRAREARESSNLKMEEVPPQTDKMA